jgi:hypothetical protein
MFNVLGMAGAVVALLGSALMGSSSASVVVTDPPDDKIVIDLVSVIGSGCPQGTTAVAVSPDNTAFTVTYSDYLAQVGVGAKPTDWRKNCQLNIIVHVPQGFTYAIASVDYRGFAALQPGSYVIQRAGYYFQGSPETHYTQNRFDGPKEDNWQKTDVTGLDALVYAPCGELRNFNINTELRVYAGSSDPKTTTSFFTIDSVDGELETTYHFAWKKCVKASK